MAFVKRPRVMKRQVKRRNVKSVKSYRRPTNLTRAVRSIALRSCESKHKFIQAENIQLYHNVVQLNSNLLATTQGTTQILRTGDEVVGQFLKVKFWLSSKADRPNVMYRLVLYSTALDSASLAFASGSSGNNMLSTIDTDKVKILKQKFIKPLPGDYSRETGSFGNERATYASFSLNLQNRKIKYSTDGGTLPKWQGNYIHFAVIAYDVFGTLVTDNIASYAWQSEFVFKDP